MSIIDNKKITIEITKWAKANTFRSGDKAVPKVRFKRLTWRTIIKAKITYKTRNSMAKSQTRSVRVTPIKLLKRLSIYIWLKSRNRSD